MEIHYMSFTNGKYAVGYWNEISESYLQTPKEISREEYLTGIKLMGGNK